MNINFYATLRLITGKKIVTLDLADDITVWQLLDRLIAQYPNLHPELLSDDDRLYTSVPVFVNGRNPRLLPKGLETLLTSEDEVSLFSPVASGRLTVESLSLQGSRNEN